MDNARTGEHFYYWHRRTYYGSEVLWHDYLVFRCRNETDKSVGRFVEIRDVAHALLQHCDKQSHGLDLNTVIDGLCWLALERGSHCPGTRKFWHSYRNDKPSNLNLNLLSAGTYFGCADLVRDLIDQGCDPAQDNDLFPAPIYLAAWTGQADMLQLMQKNLPNLNHVDFQGQFLSRLGPPQLIGAVIHGDMDIVRSVLQSLARSEAEDTSSALVSELKLGSVREDTNLWKCIRDGMKSAGSPEVYQYLMSFLECTNVEQDLKWKSDDLAQRAGRGDIAMVRYLLELGADPAYPDADNGPALCQAVRRFHNDVADLLLEQGADVNESGQYFMTPLISAAMTGNMAMVIKLLDLGAVLKRYPTDSPLMYAIWVEHPAMVELLLHRGGVTQKGARYLVEMTQWEGLDSIVAILEPWAARAAGDGLSESDSE